MKLKVILLFPGCLKAQIKSTAQFGVLAGLWYQKLL